MKVQIRMPVADDPDKVGMDWKIASGDLQGTLYRVERDGGHTPLKRNENGYLEKDLKRFGIQQARAQATLSLWQ